MNPRPSVLNLWLLSRIVSEGYELSSTMISLAVVAISQAWMKSSTRKCRPSAKRSTFSDDRLQAVSSRNMYSEHGFEALMGPDSGQVCHLLVVVSNWTPGSPQTQVALAISSQIS